MEAIRNKQKFLGHKMCEYRILKSYSLYTYTSLFKKLIKAIKRNKPFGTVTHEQKMGSTHILEHDTKQKQMIILIISNAVKNI